MASSVFISVDMEGVAGITTLRQCTRGTEDCAWARTFTDAPGPRHGARRARE